MGGAKASRISQELGARTGDSENAPYPRDGVPRPPENRIVSHGPARADLVGQVDDAPASPRVDHTVNGGTPLAKNTQDLERHALDAKNDDHPGDRRDDPRLAGIGSD